jgi:transposase
MAAPTTAACVRKTVANPEPSFELQRPSVPDLVPIDGGQKPLKTSRRPVGNTFAKLKALLRQAAERTVDGLWSAIGRIIDRFTSTECRNYFTAAGYAAA